VNRRLQEHSKNAWSSIAVRKVAEQIDWVYWDSAEPENDMDPTEDSGSGLYIEDDLALDEYVFMPLASNDSPFG
jgi:hypothetical protein